MLEDVPCPLREDIPDNPMNRADVFGNAAKVVEDYFVVPLGNIPLEESNELDLTKIEGYDRKAMDEENLLKSSENNCFNQT